MVHYTTTTIEAIGRRIRDLRTKEGWSQSKLASAACLHRNTVQSLESGNTSVNLDTLEALAYALGVSLCDIMFDPKEGLCKSAEPCKPSSQD